MNNGTITGKKTVQDKMIVTYWRKMLDIEPPNNRQEPEICFEICDHVYHQFHQCDQHHLSRHWQEHQSYQWSPWFGSPPQGRWLCWCPIPICTWIGPAAQSRTPTPLHHQICHKACNDIVLGSVFQ